jgi:hypothetical protein
MASPIFSMANVKSGSLSQHATSPFGPPPTNRVQEPVAPSSSSSSLPLFSPFPGSHTQEGPAKWQFAGCGSGGVIKEGQKISELPVSLPERSKIRIAKVPTTAEPWARPCAPMIPEHMVNLDVEPLTGLRRRLSRPQPKANLRVGTG